ncbi:9340_t:CDS:2 [Diversispora eburnea]|uniref:9340_t:CDS:1 n=1 Tax=Diversispora eburnea TaxID=1213867 RepID=A0A9N9FY94_9GLOM|nr:9340_t:CDS:2 [Diversispora eburnea]
MDIDKYLKVYPQLIQKRKALIQHRKKQTNIDYWDSSKIVLSSFSDPEVYCNINSIQDDASDPSIESAPIINVMLEELSKESSIIYPKEERINNKTNSTQENTNEISKVVPEELVIQERKSVDIKIKLTQETASIPSCELTSIY